jgi:hypothetical protein
MLSETLQAAIDAVTATRKVYGENERSGRFPLLKMVPKLDPETIHEFESIIKRSEEITKGQYPKRSHTPFVHYVISNMKDAKAYLALLVRTGEHQLVARALASRGAFPVIGHDYCLALVRNIEPKYQAIALSGRYLHAYIGAKRPVPNLANSVADIVGSWPSKIRIQFMCANSLCRVYSYLGRTRPEFSRLSTEWGKEKARYLAQERARKKKASANSESNSPLAQKENHPAAAP